MQSSFPFANRCVFLSGPTAGGKTQTGIELAKRIDAEIVSLDSMAVYRGMDVGTAKPTLSEREAVPHHLIDRIDPSEEFSVAQYIEAARRAVLEVEARGKTPLFVGGTPLYLKALLRGIFEGPPADWDIRRRWEQAAAEMGPEYPHEQLAKVDPVAAEKLSVKDQRRVIRALEVFEKTGRPISQWQSQFDQGRSAGECNVFVLDWPRERLCERIDRRVDAMFSAGLVAETRTILETSQFGRTASQAVGYREVIEHLSGVRDLPSTIDLVKTRTRQFSKRQGTWFRSLSECRLVPTQEPFDPAQIAATIASSLRGNRGQ